MSLFCGSMLFFLFCWVCWRVACLTPANFFRQYLRGLRHGIYTFVMLKEFADGGPGMNPDGYDSGFVSGLTGSLIATIASVILLLIGVFA